MHTTMLQPHRNTTPVTTLTGVATRILTCIVNSDYHISLEANIIQAENASHQDSLKFVIIYRTNTQLLK